MSRLKGFAAYDSVSSTVTLAPALQLLCKEHAKLRKGLEEAWKFAAKAPMKDKAFVEEWIVKEKKIRNAWVTHTTKEERILIAALSKYVDTDRGPLAVMRYEHERLDAMFDEWEENVKILLSDPGNEKVMAEALNQFRNVCQMKGDHCYKEEKSVYALAQSLLSDAEKLMLLQLIRKVK